MSSKDVLPLARGPARGSPPFLQPGSGALEAHADDVCITCGDVAVPLEVVEVAGSDARCRAEDGGEEVVALELVEDVQPGDRLLVHAKVALEVLERATRGEG